MKQINIYGAASQKNILSLNPSDEEMGHNLMTFLQAHSLKIASSCNGDGVCKKCVVTINEDSYLSCQQKVSDLFVKNETIRLIISYL